MLPSIFSENLFDDMFDDVFRMVPVSGGRNPLYGKHARNLMKTDVRETDATYELDVDLPGEVQFITFDRYPYSSLITPEPTLVQIDVRDMGRAAAKQLLHALKKPELMVQTYTTLPSLIAGKSTIKRQT